MKQMDVLPLLTRMSPTTPLLIYSLTDISRSVDLVRVLSKQNNDSNNNNNNDLQGEEDVHGWVTR